ncbi:hypothetical protein C5167_028567 [Papaver somniferum]|nr:hypothetical protein C5167_028567 [Papaver somniferum]
MEMASNCRYSNGRCLQKKKSVLMNENKGSWFICLELGSKDAGLSQQQGMKKRRPGRTMKEIRWSAAQLMDISRWQASNCRVHGQVGGDVNMVKLEVKKSF